MRAYIDTDVLIWHLLAVSFSPGPMSPVETAAALLPWMVRAIAGRH